MLGRADGAGRREFPDQRLAGASGPRHRHDPRQESRGRSQRCEVGRLDPGCRTRHHDRGGRRPGGQLRDQFVVDVYQAGAGTSHNMNANEVLANRAAEILGEPRGTYTRVHPNDHVNMGQSTNDVYPTATRLALVSSRYGAAGRARALWPTRRRKGSVSSPIVPEDRPDPSAGRRADDARTGVQRLRRVHRTAEPNDCRRPRPGAATGLNIGATAIGTGLNAGDDYRRHVVPSTSHDTLTCRSVAPAPNPFRSHAEHGRRAIACSGAMRRLAVELGKVASDLRLLSMGPRAGLSEIIASTCPARFIDHAGQGESMVRGNGEPEVCFRWPGATRP